MMPRLIRRWVLFILIAISSLVFLSHLLRLRKWPSNAESTARESPSPNSYSEDRDPPQWPLGIPRNGDFNWRDLPTRYPVTSPIALPAGDPADIPRIQYDFSNILETLEHRAERERRLAVIREAFEHSWEGYRSHAWLHDEVTPLSGRPHDPFGGWGATLVDTLDTLWILGMKKEFEEAVAALDKIDFKTSALKEINVFETTIRYLGGFLSAHDLTKGQYPVLVDKAVEVAELLYRAFDTPNRMPVTRWDWAKYLEGKPQEAPKSAIVAELGSLTLEFTRLTQITGDSKYYDAVQRISDLFEREQNVTRLPGLWPLTVNPREGSMRTDTAFTLGGMADSVYEYLPKQYLLLQGRRPEYGNMHLTALRTVKDHLLFEPLLSPSNGLSTPITPLPPLILGTTRISRRTGAIPTLDPRGEHLVCFAGGMIALAARALSPHRPAADTAEDLSVALRLAAGCVWSYTATPTGIGPEIFTLEPCRRGRDAVTLGAEPDTRGHHGDCTWDRKRWLAAVRKKPRDGDRDGRWEKFVAERGLGPGFVEVPDPRYMLRPEAVESLFVLWRITGEEALREAAWGMFESVVRWARTEIAFAALPDVMKLPVEGDGGGGEGKGEEEGKGIRMFDGMESFWTAETLKYFYLLFAEPEVVSLDEYVFNTEAHPFRWRDGVVD